MTTPGCALEKQGTSHTVRKPSQANMVHWERLLLRQTAWSYLIDARVQSSFDGPHHLERTDRSCSKCRTCSSERRVGFSKRSQRRLWQMHKISSFPKIRFKWSGERQTHTSRIISNSPFLVPEASTPGSAWALNPLLALMSTLSHRKAVCPLVVAWRWESR